MKHFAQFAAQENKLNELMAENMLIHNFRTDSYPMTLTITQDQSLDAQVALYEDETDGVSSKDSKLVLTFPIGEIGVRVYGRLIISETLMNKIKAHGKKLRDLYLQCDYAQRMSNAPAPEQPDSAEPETEETDEFDEFFDAEDTILEDVEDEE